MKKTLLTLTLCLAMVLTACSTGDEPSETNGTTDAPNQTTTATTQSTPETAPPSEPVTNTGSMEDLTDIEGVISVEKLEFTGEIIDAVAYKVLFESDGLKIQSDFALPADYANPNKNYPVLLYFPEISFLAEDLAARYALNGVIVARIYARGWGESEGMRDLGGSGDLADAQKLLQICDQAPFLKDTKMFAIGASEGSVTALRLFAEDSAHRISGCAVTDIIADPYSFAENGGDAAWALTEALVGKTYEEAPEEYDLRSALKFYEKLDRPILMINYTQNPTFPVEQTDALYDLLKDRNEDCSYYKIDTLSSDFNGEGYQRLLSWVNRHA